MRGARAMALAALFALAAAAPCASAFKLQALGPPVDSSAYDRQALALFASDVHERITRLACEKAGASLSDDVIAGVRWNDNPPALRLGALFGACNTPGTALAEGVGCWASMMRLDRLAWETLSRREKGVAPLRSHFGDMQFLHAMAARAGEEPGEIAPRANVFGLRRGSVLEPGTAAWMSGLLSAPEKRLWTVQDIFLPKGADLRLVAFGSVLHLVEDSYSAAHVVRAFARTQPNGCPSYDALGAIVEFHTYVEQDTEKHALCDDAPDWLEALVA